MYSVFYSILMTAILKISAKRADRIDRNVLTAGQRALVPAVRIWESKGPFSDINPHFYDMKILDIRHAN